MIPLRLPRTGGWKAGLRRLALVVGLVPVAIALPACQSADSVARQLHADIARTLASPHQFVWNDRELGTNQTVSGLYRDVYRYHLLYVSDGQPAWEEVVRDDAVADRLLAPADVQRFWARQHGHVNLPQGSVVSAALLARQWVIDATGAPAVPTLGQENVEYRNDPFDQALLFLGDVDNLITSAPPPEVRPFRPDDVTPVYKPTDDPFPAPAKGSGIVRYDLYQQPLPVSQSSGVNSLPPPPTLLNFAKVAIYVKNGLVVEVRLDTDPLDHLQELVNNYHLSLPKGLSRTDEEAFAQQAIQHLNRIGTSLPYLVRQETMVLQPLPPGTDIALPSPAVAGKLSFLHAS